MATISILGAIQMYRLNFIAWRARQLLEQQPAYPNDCIEGLADIAAV